MYRGSGGSSCLGRVRFRLISFVGRTVVYPMLGHIQKRLVLPSSRSHIPGPVPMILTPQDESTRLSAFQCLRKDWAEALVTALRTRRDHACRLHCFQKIFGCLRWFPPAHSCLLFTCYLKRERTWPNTALSPPERGVNACRYASC